MKTHERRLMQFLFEHFQDMQREPNIIKRKRLWQNNFNKPYMMEYVLSQLESI